MEPAGISPNEFGPCCLESPPALARINSDSVVWKVRRHSPNEFGLCCLESPPEADSTTADLIRRKNPTYMEPAGISPNEFGPCCLESPPALARINSDSVVWKVRRHSPNEFGLCCLESPPEADSTTADLIRRKNPTYMEPALGGFSNAQRPNSFGRTAGRTPVAPGRTISPPAQILVGAFLADRHGLWHGRRIWRLSQGLEAPKDLLHLQFEFRR